MLSRSGYSPSSSPVSVEDSFPSTSSESSPSYVYGLSSFPDSVEVESMFSTPIGLAQLQLLSF